MGGLMGSYSLHAESSPTMTANDKFAVNQAFKSGISPLMLAIVGAVVILVAMIFRR